MKIIIQNNIQFGNIRENYIYWSPKTEGNYILNSNGKKFYTSNYLGDIGKSEFIENNCYDYYTKFDMTKYDATDNITIIIELYGEPFKIELEKTNSN